MTTSTITPEIASFAEAVRDALHDLPAEERDELTDGLEADLAEAHAESSAQDLPDPIDYATKLRNAAGLPKVEPIDRGMIAAARASLSRVRTDLASAVRNNPTLEPMAEFLSAVRPLWWVVRAWVAAWIVAVFLGTQSGLAINGVGLLVLAVFIVVSVQWGRGLWRASWVSPAIVIGNVAAVLLLVPVLAQADPGGNSYDYGEPFVDPVVGLNSNGKSVTNIFAYGPDGKPLNDVQLFDQDGQPLEVERDPTRDECFDPGCTTDADGMAFAKSSLETGAVVGNVFPLSLVPTRYDPDTGEAVVDSTATPQAPKPPFIKVPAVLSAPKADPKNAPSDQ